MRIVAANDAIMLHPTAAWYAANVMVLALGLEARDALALATDHPEYGNRLQPEVATQLITSGIAPVISDWYRGTITEQQAFCRIADLMAIKAYRDW